MRRSDTAARDQALGELVDLQRGDNFGSFVHGGSLLGFLGLALLAFGSLGHHSAT